MSEITESNRETLQSREQETRLPEANAQRRWLSTDSWAVLLALAVAALVKLHILNTVRW